MRKLNTWSALAIMLALIIGGIAGMAWAKHTANSFNAETDYPHSVSNSAIIANTGTVAGNITTIMQMCESEDSTNCVWYADIQGNGQGRSFVDLNGTAHYID